MDSIIHVNAGAGYDVRIGNNLLGTLAQLPKARTAIITDDNVLSLYGNKLPSGTKIISITPGEGSKTFRTLAEILEEMAEAELTRDACVIALGGGVVGDIAGFAAGCYMRGVRLVQVPSTLLAMVDSSVGGKTAVDLKAGKNLAGLFYQPSVVLCDSDFLKTLPEEEYLCGISEALKSGILAGEELFAYFEAGTARENIEKVIAECVAYKAGVVDRDEKEKGERKLLNLGHTIGHAIEKVSGFRVKHGLAVAQGMGIIARASRKMGWCSDDTASRILGALEKNNLPSVCEYSPSELTEAALNDKKRSGETITLVIPSEIGKCELKEINISGLEEIIAKGL